MLKLILYLWEGKKMKFQFHETLKDYVLSFAKLYHQYRIETEKLQSIRYQIISSMTDYLKTKKIELSITDHPGDILPPMSIEQIKKTPDIITHMHPVDVNSINDLYYLSNDKVVEIKTTKDKIIAVTQQGTVNEYNINETLDLEKIKSPRISYMFGLMQAEKLIRKAYKENERYKIIKDNITTLHVCDNKTNNIFLKKPMEILFSGEYKLYTKDDIAKIGFICGQITKMN